MLTIRMQRTGRSGHAQYRVIVQDSRFSPTSGRVVAYLGNYDPHTKQASVDGAKAASYLQNGAQPSERVAKLLKDQGVKLPSWVDKPTKQKRAIRNPEKLRRNRPAGAPAPEPAAGSEEPAAETVETAVPVTAEAPTADASAETNPQTEEQSADSVAAEETAAESPPAEETPAEAAAEDK